MNEAPLILPGLAGKRVHLRDWRPSDASTVQAASRDSLIPFITTVPQTADEAEALAFIDRQNDRMRTRAGYAFAVTDDDDQAVGHIGLFFTKGVSARASVGYWIEASQRRRG